jgi:hypothetical protein
MTLRNRRAPLACAFAVAVTWSFGGCGGGSDGLSTATRTQLTPLVRQVRRAAESLDGQGAQRALADLQRAVAASEKRGDISSAKAVEILRAAAGVESRLALVPTTTTTATTTTTTTTPARGHGDKGKGDKGGGGND